MILRIAALLLVTLAVTVSASAQATQPAALEQQALTPTAKPLAPPAPSTGTTSSSDLLGIRQLFVGLMIVLTLIFASKWFLPRVWPAVGAQRNAGIRVLGRTPISAKNQLVLVQVGQRVLVLGENANQLSTLSTIENADEVALLIGKANARVDREPEREPRFAAALDQSNRAYDAEIPQPAESPDAETKPAASGELSELISKVRGLARHIGRS